MTNLWSNSQKNKKVMNEKEWSYSERLFSRLGDRKDENFLILTGSLTNMEDPTQAILWFSDLNLIKKAKKSQCGNWEKWERQRKTILL